MVHVLRLLSYSVILTPARQLGAGEAADAERVAGDIAHNVLGDEGRGSDRPNRRGRERAAGDEQRAQRRGKQPRHRGEILTVVRAEYR